MHEGTLKNVDAMTVKSWLDKDEAVLIDIREADEYAREHIPGAQHVPLSALQPSELAGGDDKIAVFHCNSGTRTGEAAQRLLATGFRTACQLDGGLQAWKRAGLPVDLDRRSPIIIMRQVQITAGSLVVLGVVLAVLVSPWFMALSAFVGAGLVHAGVSGTCAMASMLQLMPWNRMAAPPAAAIPAHGNGG